MIKAGIFFSIGCPQEFSQSRVAVYWLRRTTAVGLHQRLVLRCFWCWEFVYVYKCVCVCGWAFLRTHSLTLHAEILANAKRMKHCCFLSRAWVWVRPSQWGKRTQQQPRRSRIYSELWLSHLIIGALIIAAAVGRHSGISAACVHSIWK